MLRWLVDRNTDVLIDGLDDLTALITAKAIDSTGTTGSSGVDGQSPDSVQH